MNKEMVKIIRSLKGNVLGIGLEKDMVEAIERNDEITECNLLESYEKPQTGKKKRAKTIKIKKIHKHFKKKSVDYLVCQYSMIHKYMNTFVKNSIYIHSHTLYFFGDIDKELINTRYRRYNTQIKFINYKDGSIAIIDVTKAKNKRIKEIGYRIIDWITKSMDIIGDILMN